MSLDAFTTSLTVRGEVRIGMLQEGRSLPLLVVPNAPGVEVTSWVQANRPFVDQVLLQYGGILFRGFGIDSQERFDAFVSGTCEQLLDYNESSSPRTRLSNKVYTSTEHPQEQKILLHNELSYSSVWPLRIWFCSVTQAGQGGETPIADMRRVYRQIRPEVRERFERLGWMLVRNYGDGFGLPWQEVFHTEDKAVVEAYCRQHQIEFEWKDEQRLRTRQVRKAVRPHPVTGEALWFNHAAFWHESSLPSEVREMMLTLFASDELPYNTYYGDGSPIEDEVAAGLLAAYDAETVEFPWERGDLLMLDNMLVAHGRNPFVGKRQTLVAMGEPFSGYMKK
ncbi:MAG TPA: TauD/TfdA family dioxygenase [Bacilli bacterium]|nr:TauD/TfdA family dioxygenase [Bacilli bacterium]